MGREFSFTFFAVLTMGVFLNYISLGSRYIVGDTHWSIPLSPQYYSNWSSFHHFSIGDILYFDFELGFSNVVQVSKIEYEACTANNPFQGFDVGPASVTLYEKGVFYFICSISNYCSLGQKVSVVVRDPTPYVASPSPAPLVPTALSSTPSVAPEPPKAVQPNPSDQGEVPAISPASNSGYGVIVGPPHSSVAAISLGFSRISYFVAAIVFVGSI